MEDTIAAIATPLGEGGIGVIRISGPASAKILQRIFEGAGESPFPHERRLTYGRIYDPKTHQIMDECMAVFMKGPKSYTAEDTAEIQCHGSMVSLKNILRLVLREGARLAEPGEFTKRAFLNGRIDLSQAEAVMDIIKAKTDKSFDIAIEQLQGRLSLKVTEIRQRLLDVLVDLTVNIDYPDEDIEEITYEKLRDDLLLIREQVDGLREGAQSGRMLREGIRIVICGRPNVGKSSLMNALLHENRAIVTEIPGTTRDTIEESVNIRGIPVMLTDTAGIHDTQDLVEQMGIARSKNAFNEADYIILVLDGSQPLTREDRSIMETIGSRNILAVINKKDLGCLLSMEDLGECMPGASFLTVSMKEEDGIDQIEDEIEALVFGSTHAVRDHVMVNNVRHIQLLDQASSDLVRAEDMTDRAEPLDFIEVDVRSAYDALGEIIGETVSDDILNEVFSRFCLGK